MELDIDMTLWTNEIKKLQFQYMIYPHNKWAYEDHYCRVAILLANLFTSILGTIPDDLEKDFYLLARKWDLYCTKLPEEQEVKIESRTYRGEWRIDYRYPALQRMTRLALGLSPKLFEEVGNEGVDAELMVAFLKFLYRNCDPGFMTIVDGPDYDGPHTFFDTRKGFSNIPPWVVTQLTKWRRSSNPEGPFKCLYFYVALPHQNNTISIPCLYVDIDENLPDLEERINRFKIFPSIRMKTSTRGQHLFWILRQPVRMEDWFKVVYIEGSLGQLLGGDPNPGITSRLPGAFNKKYSPFHFVNFEKFPYEYGLDDFNHLPLPKFSFRRTDQLAALFIHLKVLLWCGAEQRVRNGLDVF